MSSIHKILNALADEVIGKFELLNHGGCCVFAALVARALDNKGYPVQGVAFSWQADTPSGMEKNIDELRPYLTGRHVKAWNDLGIRFGHVGIEFYDGTDIYRYDSNGIVDKDAYLEGDPAWRGKLRIEELEYLATDDGRAQGMQAWNDCFDRNHIPELQQLVAKHFKKLNTKHLKELASIA